MKLSSLEEAAPIVLPRPASGVELDNPGRIILAIVASNDEEILIGYFYDTSLVHPSAWHGGSCHPTVAVRRQEFRCGSAGHRVKDVGSPWHVNLHPVIPWCCQFLALECPRTAHQFVAILSVRNPSTKMDICGFSD